VTIRKIIKKGYIERNCYWCNLVDHGKAILEISRRNAILQSGGLGG
jgi:hypothetical protein